jgi:predicted O-linked N-acetylglucosamine transferase (SPINDLY family)
MGFCGTLGADYIDYLVADHDVIPSAAARQHYTERGILYMPQSYFVNDHKQSARYALDCAQLPGRAAYGVPEDKFVFCNFNQVDNTVTNNSYFTVNLLLKSEQAACKSVLLIVHASTQQAVLIWQCTRVFRVACFCCADSCRSN